MDEKAYDLVVIGSGPAGQKGAIAAAKMGKRVALVDKNDMIGGACLHSGTIPSKTLRLAVLYLTGFEQKSFYGQAYSAKDHVTVEDLMFRVRTVVEREQAQVTDQLKRNGVTLVSGWARFVDTHTLQTDSGEESPGRANPHRLRHALGAGSGNPLRRTQDNVGGRSRTGRPCSRSPRA